MKILIYVHNFLPRDKGGMEKYILSLIQRLKKVHEVILVLPSVHNISIKGVKIYLLPELNLSLKMRLNSVFLGINRILQSLSEQTSMLLMLPYILIKNKVDIVSVFSPGIDSTAVLLISNLLKKKTILNLRGFETEKPNIIYQFSLDSSFLVSNYILSNSMDLLKRYRERSLLPKVLFFKKNDIYLPNGININFWKPNKDRTIKREYDIVFVGNLTDKFHLINKGFRYFYEALKNLKINHDAYFRVMIIGGFNTYLLKKLIGSDIEDYFEFLGYLKDQKKLKEMIQKSKIYVLSSISEGMPNSLMEAMALEMPCIATNVGAVPQLIDNNVDILIIEPENSEMLAKNILLLLSNEKLQTKLGINARKKMINKFSWEGLIK